MSTIKVPFQIESSGRVGRVLDQNSIAKQHVMDILVTSKNERTMRPGYGAGANDLMFEPVDDLIFSEFKTDAMLEFSKHLNIATVLDVRVAPMTTPYFGDDGTSLEVSVHYRTASPGVQSLNYNIVSMDNLTEETLS